MSQTALVTGATDGIGKRTALELAQRKLSVLVHGRSQESAQRACLELRAALPSGDFTPVWGDFGELAQVRGVAEQVLARAPVLDRLLNNAGVYLHERVRSVDGFELTFAVNHLAHFLLTHLLLPALRRSGEARVINVSSIAHGQGRLSPDDLRMENVEPGYAAYATSKLLNVYFAHELARRLRGTAVTAHALHPGVITTKLLTAGFSMQGASLKQGAVTSLFVATSPSLAGRTGLYFSDGREAACAPHANNPALERALYDDGAKLCHVEPLPG